MSIVDALLWTINVYLPNEWINHLDTTDHESIIGLHYITGQDKAEQIATLNLVCFLNKEIIYSVFMEGLLAYKSTHFLSIKIHLKEKR